ncbi:hypothetical protein NEOLEDRAFT_1138761 [Neolentinus lepideus HHB14362 ss-1]|uniref:ferric-chelate reductase (NADPH) n=1 Tax=Neolentinus lepideus HHB14362 ss-1 TaxID=1314782 RepID=A0A165Q5T5_9AGAM|nr:hypothetical protein NEOLEDRAFT_1138761 [Neolentinus lepideus HHB14362 ss-1]
MSASATHGSAELTVAEPVVNPLQLALYTDVALLCGVAIFVLFTIPRFVARFSKGREWGQGALLHSTDVAPPRRSPKRRPTLNQQSSLQLGSEDSHTLNSHSHLVRRASEKAKGRVHYSFPPHVPSWSTLALPLAKILNCSVSPELSLGQAILMLSYFGGLLFVSLYESSLFTDPIRTGFVAMSQIPVVVALATKFNLIGMVTDVAYQHLNYLHRFAGLLLAIAANIHTLGYVYQWCLDGTFMKSIKRPETRWGFVATLAADILVFMSTETWRLKAYNVFFASHVVAVAILLLATCYHMPSTIPYVLAAVAFYGLDLLVRLIKTRICIARIRPIPELAFTRVEVPRLNAGWRAGQHVRLRVLSSWMGWWAWTEVHPFTIASVSKGPEGMVLMCKKAGDWTSRLYEMAKLSEYGDDAYGRDVRIWLEGPYGGPGHSVFASYSGALFIAGGSGITFALSAVQDLILQDMDGTSRVKVIELAWAVQDPAALVPLIPLFTSLLQQSNLTSLRIQVFYTRATMMDVSKIFLPPGLTLLPGRPRVPKLLDAILDCTMSVTFGNKNKTTLSGILVGVCGPAGLGKDARKAVDTVDPRRRKAVRGVELHQESFGW